MQFKVYRGSFGVIVLLLLGVIFFMLPAVLVFIAIATVASLLGSIASGLLGMKPKQKNMPQQRSTEKTIDIAAEIE